MPETKPTASPVKRRARRVRYPASGSSINPLWEASHRASHLALIAACDSPILLRFWAQLHDMNIQDHQIAGVTAYPRRNIKREHRPILDAALARDVESVVGHLTEHYRRMGLYLEMEFG